MPRSSGPSASRAGPSIPRTRAGLGPRAAGAGEEVVPGPLRPLARGLAGLLGNLPVPLPVIAPPQLLQFVHHDDVGQAFVLALTGKGPAGAYNLTGDGTLTGPELMRELGLLPLPVPEGVTRAAAEVARRIPGRPPALEWSEALSHPLVVDASKAKQELGWEPAYTSVQALRDTLRAG